MLDASLPDGSRAGLLGCLAAAVAGGVDLVQLRDRRLEGGPLLELADAVCRTAREVAARAGRSVRIVVNRRADVALAAGADGVHLGFDAVDAATARQRLGPDALVGVSCHAPAEVGTAAEASYAQLAPVFAPLSKAASRPALGAAALREASKGGKVLAQGGIEVDNAAACIAAGAAGVAVTGAILMARHPGEAAQALRRALDRAVRGSTI